MTRRLVAAQDQADHLGADLDVGQPVAIDLGVEQARLEVVGTLEELRERIPPQLYDSVATAAKQPAVEDLDI